jgi:hypothetical protein
MEKFTNNITSSASISLFFIALSQKSGTPVGNIQIFSNKNIKRLFTYRPTITNSNLRNKKYQGEKR